MASVDRPGRKQDEHQSIHSKLGAIGGQLNVPTHPATYLGGIQESLALNVLSKAGQDSSNRCLKDGYLVLGVIRRRGCDCGCGLLLPFLEGQHRSHIEFSLHRIERQSFSPLMPAAPLTLGDPASSCVDDLVRGI